MSLKIEEILNELEENSTATPENDFAAGLLGKEAQEKTASDNTEETTEEAAPETTDEDLVKEADAQGRIMARAFVEELNKVAVAPVADYPADPGAIPNNPALELPRGEGNQPHAEQNAKVNAIIGQLTAANKVGAGEIAGPAGVMSMEEKTPGNEVQVAADAAKEQEQAATGGGPSGEVKTSAEDIISSLYNTYFGE